MIISSTRRISPNCWKDLTITIEVEAKAKELAILKLKEDLSTAVKSKFNFLQFSQK
ncbi:MAG: hypothetical protein R2874_17055 [Desulfobacterales bacterium]